jgi:hypothetical protein
MNDATGVWLNLSFFYNQKDWPHFIRHALQPYLETEKRKGHLERYHICLNQHRGDNIHLAFYVPVSLKVVFLKDADRHFGAYFKACPSDGEQWKSTPYDIFMDFPNNTVQYNIYKLPAMMQEKHFPAMVETLRYAITEAYLQAYTSLLTTPPPVLFFSFQLHLLMLQSFNASLDKTLEALDGLILATKFNETSAKILTEQDQLFVNNKERLLQLLKDTWYNSNGKLPYEEYWTQTCTVIKTQCPRFNDYIQATAVPIYQQVGPKTHPPFTTLYLCYRAILALKEKVFPAA